MTSEQAPRRVLVIGIRDARRARRHAAMLVLAAMLGWHLGAPRDSNR